MGTYDVMQVCKKFGHKTTDSYNSYPQHRQKFCDQCGSETITQCQHCKANIRGYYHVDGVIGGGGPAVPQNCHECGKPYPWRNWLATMRFLRSLMSPLKYLVDSIVGIFKR